ncbi:MAG: class I SAM-dependent methyltransferase [Patescibacteria group bacterium]
MKSQLIGRVRECQICLNKNLELMLPLGHQLPVSSYLTEEQLHEAEITYPLNLIRCSKCGLLQLDYIIDPTIAFPFKYPYRSGLTNMLIRNFRSLADLLTEKYGLTSKDLIVDIGSNDGTLLQGFKEKGMKVAGIEPTDAADVANADGIPTVQDFINKKSVKEITDKYGKAKIVTATNVFAHINNMAELIPNIKDLMAEDGVFVSESQYLMDIAEKSAFDTIYHDHLRYYSLKPLEYLFNSFGCTLVDAERITAAGGSIRAFAMKGKQKQSERVKELIKQEEEMGIYDVKFWSKFRTQAVEAKNDLLMLILQCKKEGAQIAGLTSSARSNTLLGFTGINNQFLDYIGEKSGSPKIGLYTPGTHIPVVDEKEIVKNQSDYVLVLSWHIGDELMGIMRKLGYKGKFIIPLPKPKIVQ